MLCRICSELDGQFGDILKDTQHFLCKEKGDGNVTLLDKVRYTHYILYMLFLDLL
jgi:hypothetical protein